jgi:hypothetical protein
MGAFLTFSLLSAIGVGALLALALLRGSSLLPPALLAAPEEASIAMPTGHSLLSGAYSPLAVLGAIGFMVIAVPVCSLLVIRHFGKTQAPECFYYALFLAACLTEVTRLFIPLFDLWTGSTAILTTLTRLLFFGRLVAPAAFLFSSVFAMFRQYREEERNCGILLALSGVLAMMIPVKTTVILPTYMAEIGFDPLYRSYLQVLFLCTIATLLIEGRNRGKEGFLLALGYALLFAGYLILLSTVTYPALALGGLLFITGTYVYLINLHRLYI